MLFSLFLKALKHESVFSFGQNLSAYKTAWKLLKVCFNVFNCVDIPEKPQEFLFVLQGADGVLLPGGYGERGVEGKILAAKYARENNIPFLGICLGMQVAVIEFARSVLCLHDANSTEFKPDTKHPCIIFMPEVP